MAQSQKSSSSSLREAKRSGTFIPSSSIRRSEISETSGTSINSSLNETKMLGTFINNSLSEAKMSGTSIISNSLSEAKMSGTFTISSTIRKVER